MSDNNPNETTPNDAPTTGNMTIFTNIFTSPATAMTQVQERYSIALPMLTFLVLMGLSMYTYYAMVDYVWFVDYMVETTAGELSKAEQDQTRQGMSMMSQGVMGIVATVSAMIMIAIIYVIQAVYFLIISNVKNDGYSFKQWLSFVSWTALPGLLAIIAMFAYILSSTNGQIPPDSLNPLSLNELIFGMDSSKGLGKLLSSIHLAQFWSLAVMVIGYKVWTKSTMANAATIVLLPFVLFYAGWYFLFV